MGHHHDEAEECAPFLLEGASGEGRHITVTAAKRQWLEARLERQWGRPPTPAESDRSVAGFVREEILYREALALGLDRNDLVVRRRLVQKMEMLALQRGPSLTESDLMAHYLAHRADYTVPELVSFEHIFFSAAIRGAAAFKAAEAAFRDIQHSPEGKVNGLGDPPPTPPAVTAWTRTMVEGRFGADFAAAAFEFEPGAWSGPVASAYGYHLVLVTRREECRAPDFSDVADRVATEIDTERREGALERIYATVRDAYEIEIEPAINPVHGGTDRARTTA